MIAAAIIGAYQSQHAHCLTISIHNGARLKSFTFIRSSGCLVISTALALAGTNFLHHRWFRGIQNGCQYQIKIDYIFECEREWVCVCVAVYVYVCEFRCFSPHVCLISLWQVFQLQRNLSERRMRRSDFFSCFFFRCCCCSFSIAPKQPSSDPFSHLIVGFISSPRASILHAPSIEPINISTI